MAKKKGKRRRSYKKKSKKSTGPKAKPMGLAAGATLTGVDMVFGKPPSGISSPFDQLVASRDIKDSIKWTAEALKQNLVDLSNYKYAAVGLVITASPKIPIVSLLAKPADAGLKRLTKGKWGA